MEISGADFHVFSKGVQYNQGECSEKYYFSMKIEKKVCLIFMLIRHKKG
jgi:hypothetical protein